VVKRNKCHLNLLTLRRLEIEEREKSKSTDVEEAED
jgi:hypothetical protein